MKQVILSIIELHFSVVWFEMNNPEWDPIGYNDSDWRRWSGLGPAKMIKLLQLFHVGIRDMLYLMEHRACKLKERYSRASPLYCIYSDTERIVGRKKRICFKQTVTLIMCI